MGINRRVLWGQGRQRENLNKYVTECIQGLEEKDIFGTYDLANPNTTRWSFHIITNVEKNAGI